MPSGRSRVAAAKLRKSDASAGAGTLAAILVALSLVFFTVSARDDGSGFFGQVRSAVQVVVSPVQLLGSMVTSPFTGLSNVFRNLTAGEQTLAELKSENERLAARNVELEEAQLSAQRLQELLELRDTYSLQSMAARVIAGSGDSWTDSVIIDHGTSSGLAVGMPVANETGAVGQIIQCTATTSTVRLLADEASSVSAMLQESRAQGMLQGGVDGTLRLSMIRTDQQVQPGDVVVTSGLGGVFPKGLPLGKVATVESRPGESYYQIVVEPFSRVGNLEEVLVITSLTDGQEATDEDIAKADAVDLDAASGHSAKRLVPENEKKDEDDETGTTDEESTTVNDEDDESAGMTSGGATGSGTTATIGGASGGTNAQTTEVQGMQGGVSQDAG